MEKRIVNKLILFGAGVYAKKYKALLEYLQIDFDYFSDNDQSKWGSVLYEKLIISPAKLKDFKYCKIIISCTHEIAIRNQLTELGLQDCIIGLDELYELCEKKMARYKENNVHTNGQKTVILDMYEGIGWGGTELWAANLAYLLSKKKIKSILIGSQEQPSLEAEYETMVSRVGNRNTIMEIVNLIEKNLPCVFINNFAGCAFMAAALVKRLHPDKLKIISVIHNDNTSLFEAHMLMSQYIDAIFCVSRQIKEHMCYLYKFDYKKYFFKEQPIAVDENLLPRHKRKGVLRIGYAGRLVKQQKRADLLIKLIQSMEEKKINYHFQIAGEGECMNIIQNYIMHNKIEMKVQLLGRVAKSKMPQFWKQQDIFINISEYEGTSLSMLEAMSYGCVPVVTDVSGVKEFIDHEVNGFICNIGDFSQMTEYIDQLSHDRDALALFGNRSRERVKEKCNIQEYADYWIEKLIC